MTLFYSKRSGDIQTFCSGIQDMNFFDENKKDYEIIWDFLIVDKDNFVLENIKLFKVDIYTKELVYTAQLTNKYRII